MIIEDQQMEALQTEMSQLKRRVDELTSENDFLRDLCLANGIEYEEMLAAFPDAKVLLTYRDPEKWYASIQSMLVLLRIVDILVAPLPYGRKIMAVARFHLYGNAAGAFGADTSPPKSDHIPFPWLIPFVG